MYYRGSRIVANYNSALNSGTAIGTFRALESQAVFGGSVTGDGNVSSTGGYFESSGNMGTTGSTSHYGSEFVVSGTADSNIGISVSVSGATNDYGILIGAPSAASTDYAIYSSATAQSYFAGNIGIGDTTPDWKLDIEASHSAAASDFSVVEITGNDGGTLSNASTKAALKVSSTHSAAVFMGGDSAEIQAGKFTETFSGAVDSNGNGDWVYSSGVKGTSIFAGSVDTSDLAYVKGVSGHAEGNASGLGDVYHIGVAGSAVGTGLINAGLWAGAELGISGATNNYGIYITSPGAGATNYAIYSVTTAKSHLNGTLKIGGTALRSGTEGTNQLDIFDGTAPVGTLTNGISLYSTAGELRVMDAAGNATLLSPHENENNYWVFDSSNSETGKDLVIDMELIIKDLNDSLELDYVHETQDGELIERGGGSILTKILDKIAEWLADAANGITKIFTNEIETKNLCVSDDTGDKTCITKAELDQLLQNAGQSNVISGGGGSAGAETGAEAAADPTTLETLTEETPHADPVVETSVVEETPPAPEPTPEPEPAPEPVASSEPSA